MNPEIPAITETTRDRVSSWQIVQRIAREDGVTLGALVLLAGLAWQWTLHVADAMNAMADMPDMPRMIEADVLYWDFARIASTFAMWTVMMIAMMLPSATPIVLLQRRMSAHYRAQNNEHRLPSTGWLVLGYLLVWIGFSLAATLAQIGLSRAAQLTSSMTLVDRRWAAAVVLAAGIYQLTPIKRRCLTQCRSPLAFLTQHYRAGEFGAFRMGIAHGAFCLGCCWAAMALLFVGGVMNPLWIAGLSIFVLIEKLLPFGERIGALLGIIALAFGIYLLL